jgi:hypothetical protein
VNGSLDVKVRQGTPLLLTAAVGHPFRAPRRWRGNPIRLQNKQGQWFPLVRLVVRNADGQVVAWPWVLEAKPAGVLELNHTTEGTVSGFLSPEASSQLAPGRYTLTLVLDSTRDGAVGSFQGRQEASPASIDILSVATVLTPEAEVLEAWKRSDYFLARGANDRAREVSRAIAAKYPARHDAIGTQAHVLAMTGDVDGAEALFSQAATLYEQENPSSQEPSAYIMRIAELRRMKQRAALRGGPGDLSAPPRGGAPSSRGTPRSPGGSAGK